MFICIKETESAQRAYNFEDWPKGLSVVPNYQTEGAAGCDLVSTERLVVFPGESKTIPTGIAIALPVGLEAQVRGRSGLWFKHHVSAFLGTIDSDYRGEIAASLTNHGKEPFFVYPGDRIAQMVIAPVYQPEWELVEALPESGRGEAGFGSTGVRNENN